MNKIGVEKVVKGIGLLGVFAVMLFLSSCKSNIDIAKNDNRSYKDLLDHLEACKVKITKVQPFSPLSPQADMGALLTIAGEDVVVLKYDLSQKKQERKYRHILEKRVLYIMGVPYIPIFNGAFVMVDYANNPKKDDIVKAFKSFGFK